MESVGGDVLVPKRPEEHCPQWAISLLYFISFLKSVKECRVPHWSWHWQMFMRPVMLISGHSAWDVLTLFNWLFGSKTLKCIPATRRLFLFPLKSAWKGLIKMFWCGSSPIWRCGFVFMVARPDFRAQKHPQTWSFVSSWKRLQQQGVEMFCIVFDRGRRWNSSWTFSPSQKWLS